MKVRDLMTTGIPACHPEDTLADATTWMWKSDCDCLPVVDWEGHVIGQISDKDVRIALNDTTRTAADVQVSEAVATSTSKCSPDDELDQALHSMRENALRLIIVVNADDTPAGVLNAD